MKTRANTWRGARKAHQIAAFLGQAGRKGRKKGPRSPSRYLAAAGVTRAGLQKYVAARKTPIARLRSRRKSKARVMGVAWNAHAYRRFVAGYIRRHHRPGAADAPGLMRRAAAAWRGGARRNQTTMPGTVYYNSLYRSPSGRYTARKSRGARPLHRRAGQRGGWRNPKAGRKARRNSPKMRRDRRGRFLGRSRRNMGGAILPYAAYNGAILPYAAFNPEAGPVEAITGAVSTVFTPEFWLQNVLPLGGGFIGSQFAGGMIYALSEKVLGTQTGFAGSLQRIGSRTLGAAGLSAATLFVSKDQDMATKVLAGGLIAVLVQVIQEVFGMETYSKMTGALPMMGGLAADLTQQLKNRIAASVRSRMAGGPGVSAFVNTQDLVQSPEIGPGPRVQGMGAFVNREDIRMAPVAQTYGSEPPVVADLDTFQNEGMDALLV